MDPEITGEEFAVLRGAETHPDSAYQPPIELLAAANRLLERGLIQKAYDFQDVLVTTDEGWRVYTAELDRRDAAEEAGR